MKRLVALTPPPNARLRPVITRQAEAPAPAPSQPLASPPKNKRRLDWAMLHQLLKCPCGGRRRIHAAHATRA